MEHADKVLAPTILKPKKQDVMSSDELAADLLCMDYNTRLSAVKQCEAQMQAKASMH